MTTALPARARVVVIGGGVIGTSIAYHLGHLGWSDTVLVERDKLTSGTTWHAAGLMITFGSTSTTSTEARMYTRDLYASLESETGLATGFKPIGYIDIATDSGRLEEFRRVAAFNRYSGIDVHEISAREVGDLFPLAQTDDVLAGFYVAGDGRVNPVDATMSMAKGARQQGVTIAQGVTVLGVNTRNGAVCSVTTSHGTIECEFVVNAAGMWARQLGEKSGVTIPLQAAEHYYLITEQMDGIDPNMPVLEDPARFGYYREEVGGLMIGLFESVCAPWKVEGIPDDASFITLQPDWDRMAPFVETAMSRIPRAQDTGIRTFFCGPESFTPDLEPIIGPAPEVRNYFVAAGLNSIGILSGGGLGRLIAHWIVDGDPGADVTAIHPDRFHPYQSNPEYRRTRTVESLGMTYQCHYPNRMLHTARDAKRSPLHDRLAEQGACFRDTSGWETPDWFAGPHRQVDEGPLTWGRPSYWAQWEAEHRACREGVIVMDMSFMSKFRVQGRDAGLLLDTLSANAVNADSGRITYTQWLNERGTIEADLTVTKLGDDDFLVIASDTAHRHVEAHMRRHFGNAHVFVTDVSSGFAQINVQGPRSRELLQALTSADLSNDAFPFRTAREIDLGFARVLCTRITYLGELGYELVISTEQAVHVYDLLVGEGKRFGLLHAGLKALTSLRMEKGYRDFGHDIDNTDSPLEVGLGFAVDLNKPCGFVGRDALVAYKQHGPLTRRLVSVCLVDPLPLLYHAEVIHRNGVPVGYVRAASYGHTLGASVGLAMVDAGQEPLTTSWLSEGQWTVEVVNQHYEAATSLRPFYDPDSARIRG
ncbi:MAG: GcvT family protein [Ilumatobacteraceae bacterium]